MMEKIPSGLTWNQVNNLFDADQEYGIILELRPRRSSLGVRKKKDLKEERKVWRVIIQKDYKNYIKTIIRYNIKTDDEALRKQKVTDKQISKINNLLRL